MACSLYSFVFVFGFTRGRGAVLEFYGLIFSIIKANYFHYFLLFRDADELMSRVQAADASIPSDLGRDVSTVQALQR